MTSAEEHFAKVGMTVVKNAPVKDLAPDGAGTESTAKFTLTLERATTMDAHMYIPVTCTRPNAGFHPQFTSRSRWPYEDQSLNSAS